ncbi:LysR substrate-binding domain-containing protein [Pseudomonas sp. TNT2022 ID1044]|uniref:LysR substrate-binding domain-containing protein n=1 Tax=Pseudomonas sp. TNT2022 ID1044 TaxID=2942636 RepID=UPI002362439C|nr:LysR substrate-binding domain-containing protein [Pseudomonas sp. TNT2022 ID1044]MDD0999231.1 LysR substrate-binding domain-containing protein [Pseudomonas sp. TNT2022 ID1044]
MRYDLNLLPVFMALMEERSVTRAAVRLGITQPALSNALNRLRDTLRDPLFIRERYGIKPTQFAEEIAPVILETLARLDEVIIGRQHFDPATSTRQFNIAPNSFVEIVLMPRIIAKLRQQAPGVKVSLTPYGNDLTETGVISGTTDMALGRIIDPPDNLIVQHLMDDGLACVVRADHPDIADSLSREQYEQLRHVNVLPPGRMRVGLFQALERQGLRRDLAISVTHFLAVPEIIAVTDYCATLPRLICRQIAKDPRLKIVPSPVDLGSFPVEIAWHVRYRQDPAHQWLRQLLVETASELTGETTEPGE